MFFADIRLGCWFCVHVTYWSRLWWSNTQVKGTDAYKQYYSYIRLFKHCIVVRLQSYTFILLLSFRADDKHQWWQTDKVKTYEKTSAVNLHHYSFSEVKELFSKAILLFGTHLSPWWMIQSSGSTAKAFYWTENINLALFIPIHYVWTRALKLLAGLCLAF